MEVSSKIYRNKFSQHKSKAKARGIPFLLTYEEWLKIWIDSGHLHERDCRRHQFAMAKFGDIGPYAIGNVKIITNAENVSEGNLGKKVSEKLRRTTRETNLKRFQSKEAREAVAESNRRRGVSQETKDKISKSLAGRTLSLEHRKRISEGLARSRQ